MKLSKPILIAATLATAIGGVYAVADGKRDSHRDRFPIDLSVAEQKMADRFDAIDTNDDELISLAEFKDQPVIDGKRWRNKFHGKKGRHGMSENHADRKAQRAERKAAFETAMFTALDKDGDGQLSATESSSENRRAAKQALFQAHRFERLDADGNSTLSRAEFGDRLERLRSADTDGDGVVSREEAKAAHRGGRRGEHRDSPRANAEV